MFLFVIGKTGALGAKPLGAEQSRAEQRMTKLNSYVVWSLGHTGSKRGLTPLSQPCFPAVRVHH